MQKWYLPLLGLLLSLLAGLRGRSGDLESSSCLARGFFLSPSDPLLRCLPFLSRLSSLLPRALAGDRESARAPLPLLPPLGGDERRGGGERAFLSRERERSLRPRPLDDERSLDLLLSSSRPFLLRSSSSLSRPRPSSAQHRAPTTPHLSRPAALPPLT